MGVKVKSVEATPNPNAKKFLLEKSISEQPRSYLTADAAASDPLAMALFALGGVETVLILGDFVTVNKLPSAEWKTLTPAVKKVLAKA